MSWNPSVYLTYADERTRPAADLLTRVPAENPQRVADLGCGPGNSTALLAGRWPRAKIEGVDSSPQMIEAAKKSGVAADFTLADLASWKPDAPYDVVFSNATYQWLPDHCALLPRLMGFVAKGGTFAFQVPNNQYSPSHTLMRDVAAQGTWAEKLAHVRGIFVEKVQTYYDILAPHAVSLDIWTSEYLHVLEGEDAIARNREVMGATNPANAAEGTIRKVHALSIGENSVHGSDAPETAAQEIRFWFSDTEIVG